MLKTIIILKKLGVECIKGKNLKVQYIINGNNVEQKITVSAGMFIYLISYIQLEIKNCLNLNKNEKNKRNTANSALFIFNPKKKMLFVIILLVAKIVSK